MEALKPSAIRGIMIRKNIRELLLLNIASLKYKIEFYLLSVLQPCIAHTSVQLKSLLFYVIAVTKLNVFLKGYCVTVKSIYLS